jgi:hypothetical protein
MLVLARNRARMASDASILIDYETVAHARTLSCHPVPQDGGFRPKVDAIPRRRGRAIRRELVKLHER